MSIFAAYVQGLVLCQVNSTSSSCETVSDLKARSRIGTTNVLHYVWSSWRNDFRRWEKPTAAWEHMDRGNFSITEWKKAWQFRVVNFIFSFYEKKRRKKQKERILISGGSKSVIEKSLRSLRSFWYESVYQFLLNSQFYESLNNAHCLLEDKHVLFLSFEFKRFTKHDLLDCITDRFYIASNDPWSLSAIVPNAFLLSCFFVSIA